MYENPYFGNPYLQQNQQRYGNPYQQPVQQMQAQQPAYNQMQQVPQQIQQPQLIGHIVDSQETIQASDVPMNAPYALFPKNDLSEIYLKSWTANGTIQTIVFKPVQNQQTDNLPSTQSEMKIGLSDDATEAFMKRFDELGRKLDELENSMSNSKPKTRSRNIYVSVTDSYFNNSKIVGLTQYKSGDSITCSTPQMTKISENLFLVMWEEKDLSTNKVVTKAMTIDSGAATISKAITLSYRLSDCQPVLCSDRGVKWYVTNSASPKMYSIDPYDLTMPNTVSDLRASSNGKNKVLVSWTKSAAADGYLIYAQKNKKYGYCGMTSKTSFVDKKTLDNDYNFYWVYPYVMGADGNRIVGKSPAYVYAKGICASVTNLKAASQNGAVKLTWTKSADAEGYLIYGKTESGKYGYIGMTSKTGYIDKKASKKEWNFYWVFPYYKNADGKMIVGQTGKYVYGKAK